jgi:hypothetical protein
LSLVRATRIAQSRRCAISRPRWFCGTLAEWQRSVARPVAHLRRTGASHFRPRFAFRSLTPGSPARRVYRAGANDMAKGAARPARARSVRRSLVWRLTTGAERSPCSRPTMTDAEYSASRSRKKSRSRPGTTRCDASSNTLLAPDSALYRKAVAMRVGQPVTFAGTFFTANPDCIRESA